MPVIVIGLDSAEPRLIEQWMADGSLPNMQNLKNSGVYGRLDNYDLFAAELPWTTFATGTTPENTGYWTPLKYSPDYRIETRAAYEYDEYPAFYALGDDYRVCSFDIPQVRLQPELKGIQINAWGAHSPQIEQESSPPPALAQIRASVGWHPGLHRDYAHALNMKSTLQVYNMLMTGIEYRGDACIELLKKENWDLFITVFGEAHGAGHNFWQFQPEHPLYHADIANKNLLPKDPLKDTYMAMDQQIGRIIENSPKDSEIIVFSAHGMGMNTMDLPSCLFLPEFLYRYNFNRPALCNGVDGNGELTKEPLTAQKWNDWERHIWSSLSVGSAIARWSRQKLRSKLYNLLAPIVGDDVDGYPMSPRTSAKVNAGKPWYQPTLWYANLWPTMRAYALPSFSDGYIRINVKGRETHGIVEPEQYHQELDAICAALEGLVCARSGTPMIKKIVRTRKDPMDTNPKLNDADLVIGWQETFASDSVRHPSYGLIGPAPHFRAGSHRHSGFFMAAGGKLPVGLSVQGHALDVGPTILQRLGAPIPLTMQGKPLI
ncbi:alkaline phosphatase family protein [Marinagarivorans algicola]|uniref:alkaline phosphatase family protein n=1 Tax=Marinagarivorans algicola TaxID=1513270 RepID=UPI0006B8EA35|nr:alkaline phosphatase family protein [Marinagarivorans algicola]